MRKDGVVVVRLGRQRRAPGPRLQHHGHDQGQFERHLDDVVELTASGYSTVSIHQHRLMREILQSAFAFQGSGRQRVANHHRIQTRAITGLTDSNTFLIRLPRIRSGCQFGTSFGFTGCQSVF